MAELCESCYFDFKAAPRFHPIRFFLEKTIFFSTFIHKTFCFKQMTVLNICNFSLACFKIILVSSFILRHDVLQ